MAIVLASTTSLQSEMDRVVNDDNWRTPPSTPQEPAVSDGDTIPLDKLPPKKFNEIRDAQARENKDAARDALNGEEKRYRHKGSGESKRIGQLTRQKYELLEKLSKYESLDALDLTPTERRRLEEKGLAKAPANSNANGSNGAPAAIQNRVQAQVPAAVAALVANQTFKPKPPTNLEEWTLHHYIEVAANIGRIEPRTLTEARLAKDFRNLIHPGRSQRLGQKCDRGTALECVAALEHVVADLSRWP